MHRKRSTWTHCIYLTTRGYLKKWMSKCWSCLCHQSHDINHMEMVARTWMLTPALHLESGWIIERANEKVEHTIRFLALNSAKLTIEFLNFEKLRIWGSRNLFDSPYIPQRFCSMGGLEICNSKGESNLAIAIPMENHEKWLQNWLYSDMDKNYLLGKISKIMVPLPTSTVVKVPPPHWKMAKKCRTLMEKWTAPLRLWHREVLKRYKICQNMTKWNFGPPAKHCLPPPGHNEKLCLKKFHLGIFWSGWLFDLVKVSIHMEQVGWSNPTSFFLYITNQNFLKLMFWLGRAHPSYQPMASSMH